MDIAEVLKRAKAPERTVDLCLDADLAAEHDQLTRQLTEAQQNIATTMADSGKTAVIARQIRDVEERMRASVVTFRMRGLSTHKRDEWLNAHPARNDKENWNPVTGTPALIAASCVEPAMTEAQAVELCELLGTGQTSQLFAAAWEATNGDSSVPFSVAASATLRGLAPKQ